MICWNGRSNNVACQNDGTVECQLCISGISSAYGQQFRNGPKLIAHR